jgi:hypothetical protein
MKFKLFRRRLTISAPRMAVRSALPWPFRWAVIAIVLGFCAAIGLWAFQFGKDIAGLDRDAKEELVKLRAEAASMRDERDKAQSISNTSGSLLTAEKATQAKLSVRIQQLEIENRALRDDLGFFEKLLPAGGVEGISIRGLQAEMLGTAQVKWQVLVIQSVKNAPDFSGRLEVVFSGTQAGKPWTMGLPGGGQVLQFRQYRRIEGVLDLPPQTVLKNVSAKVVDGTTTRAVQTMKL